jgi:hypothetical protein
MPLSGRANRLNAVHAAPCRIEGGGQLCNLMRLGNYRTKWHRSTPRPTKSSFYGLALQLGNGAKSKKAGHHEGDRLKSTDEAPRKGARAHLVNGAA